MHSIVTAQPWAPEDLWAYAVADRALEEALAALTDAQIAVQALQPQASWTSKGVRVLRDRLAELAVELPRVAGTVQVCQGALRGGLA
ncbi:MAG: hypothetical protein WA971_13680 [Microbacterium sp.]